MKYIHMCPMCPMCAQVKKGTGATIRGWSIVFERLGTVEEENENENTKEELQTRSAINNNCSVPSDPSDPKVATEKQPREDEENKAKQREDEIAQLTLEADRYATTHLGALIFPIVVGFAIQSLLMNKYTSWYSWIVTTLTGCV